jgi:thiamine biosynthesis lipoprotein
VAKLLADCQRVHRDTEGAFDVTTTPLSRCWGFLRREARVPPLEAIEDARRQVGFGAVHVSSDPPSVTFNRPGIEVSLGAVGKGYALDRARAVLRASGVQHALLSAGGSSIVALGGRGDGWVVDVVSPLRPGRPIATLSLRNAALGTSGAGEQFVVQDGRRYGHVIDPRTGWPVDGTLSATVVASDAARADALSTAFLVGGLDLARRYCGEHPAVLALITPDDGSERTIVVGDHLAARVASD